MLKLKFILKFIFGVGISAMFLNCKVHKYPAVFDGSKADGTVAMFYEYGILDKPVVHWEEAKEEATQKCKNWGYNGFDFFGSALTECVAYNNENGCIAWRVIAKGQCTE